MTRLPASLPPAGTSEAPADAVVGAEAELEDPSDLLHPVGTFAQVGIPLHASVHTHGPDSTGRGSRAGAPCGGSGCSILWSTLSPSHTLNCSFHAYALSSSLSCTAVNPPACHPRPHLWQVHTIVPTDQGAQLLLVGHRRIERTGLVSWVMAQLPKLSPHLFKRHQLCPAAGAHPVTACRACRACPGAMHALVLYSPACRVRLHPLLLRPWGCRLRGTRFGCPSHT